MDFQTLNLYGWLTISSFEEPLENIKNALCENSGRTAVRIEHEILQPKKSNDTTHFSLSSEYGLDNFPLHTDGAQYSIPPRYMILRAKTDSETGTTIANAQLLKKLNLWEIIETTTWIVKADIGNIYTSLFNRHIVEGCEVLRYNKQIMRCLNNKRKSEQVEDAIQNLPIETINWRKNTTLVIDNWKLLHGREQVKDPNYQNRILERLQIFI
jgi:alpha-ketoglutarate-dependent taurine dioxygenase